MFARWTNAWPMLLVLAAGTLLAAARGCDGDQTVDGATRDNGTRDNARRNDGAHGARRAARDPGKDRGSPEPIRVRPGERFVVRGPSIPVHPMFRGARTEADYDQRLLRLVESELDARKLGAAAAQLTFEALRPGKGTIELKLVTAKGKVEKTVSQPFEISRGRR